MSKVIRRRTLPDHLSPLASSELHPLLVRVYAARGLQSAQELDLSLEQLLAPTTLLNAGRAGTLLADALEHDRSILVVGDFDADGATSTALAVSALGAFGASRVGYLVPNRFEYGYGLTPEIVELAAERAPDIIITVDNGISSIEGVAAAAALGIQTLVTDHHLPGRQLPEAEVIVNPNQPGCDFASKNLAGVGVIFYVMMALRLELRRRGWFDSRPEVHLGQFLDLVALGTVADVVPLDHNNRVLVEAGLKRVRAGRARAGINALLDVAGRSHRSVVASDFGFAVGPRVNAAGRLDDMSVGIECLLTQDPSRAHALAAELHRLNQDRRVIEKGMQDEALQKIAELPFEEAELPVAVTLYRGDWHQGVIGILASRIKERLHRPTIAFADDDGDQVKGS
ncbi:MAG: single-stranded-DNA-specific exonuclease RecJ, partial [Halioglobus sp.]